MAQITMSDNLHYEACFLNITEDTPMPETLEFVSRVKQAFEAAGNTHMEVSCEFTAEEKAREDKREPCPHYDS